MLTSHGRQPHKTPSISTKTMSVVPREAQPSTAITPLSTYTVLHTRLEGEQGEDTMRPAKRSKRTVDDTDDTTMVDAPGEDTTEAQQKPTVRCHLQKRFWFVLR
jgi:hypothetical protein